MRINEAFYKELFTTLLANMPKDTRNMVTQSKLVGTQDIGSHWVITITGPYATHPDNTGKTTGDYAYNVNYNERRGAKEIRNYKYVERNIKHVAGLYNMRVVDLVG